MYDSGPGNACTLKGKDSCSKKPNFARDAKKGFPNQHDSTTCSSAPCTEERIKCREDIPIILESLIPAWTASETINTRVSGGITNTIYRAHQISKPETAVLVRVFGGEDVFSAEARCRENQIYNVLSEKGVAPKLLGIFGNGRLENWVNARSITLDEMTAKHVGIGVAKRMAQLHKVDNIPCFSPNGIANQVQLWGVLEQWAEEARQFGKEGRFQNIDVENCFSYLKVVKERLKALGSPVVFAHNDLLCGNILVSSEDRNEITLVDFEYGGYNYRGFDIGNYFCEAMGGTIDGHVYPSKYPTDAFRREFCEVYLSTCGEECSSDKAEMLMAEAKKFEQAVHLYWGFWGLVESVGSTVDFPYETFAEQRFREFFKLL